MKLTSTAFGRRIIARLSEALAHGWARQGTAKTTEKLRRSEVYRASQMPDEPIIVMLRRIDAKLDHLGNNVAALNTRVDAHARLFDTIRQDFRTIRASLNEITTRPGGPSDE